MPKKRKKCKYYYAITHRRNLKPLDAVGPFSTYEEAKFEMDQQDNDDCDYDVLLCENHKWYRCRQNYKWEIDKYGMPAKENNYEYV